MLVLGAGASMGSKRYPIESSFQESLTAKMPSAKNFFHDIFYSPKTERRSQTFLNMLGLTYEGVNNLLITAWGMTNNQKGFDPEEWKNINIEDVMTFLDIGEKMYPIGSDYHKVFSKAKEYLFDFIKLIIGVKAEGQHCEYLMEILFKLKRTDNIISFNWDTLADFTLQHTNIPQFKNYIKILQDQDINIEKYKNRGVYLKLHGSMNWRSCTNKKCKMYNKIMIGMRSKYKLEPRFINLATCPYCKHDKRKTYIVPPLSDKMIHSNTLIHKLWLLAREKLAKTDKIIFIGYSFPNVDYTSEWLFRQIYFLDSKKPEIIIVNPEASKKSSLVYKRYLSIFKQCKIHTFKTLSDFAIDDFDKINNLNERVHR